MANIEIERKFLVVGEDWKTNAKALRIAQGYLVNDKEMTVRTRQKGDKAFLTIKAGSKGIGRLEFEYEIPVSDAHEMLEKLCACPPIDKTRYEVVVDGMIWEVDEFHGANNGLIMAEIELESADQAFEKPSWAGPEVSEDERFFNAYLSEKPFTSWGISQQQLIAELGE